MSSEEFRFKRFALKHRRSSMPVGTDGVLLGAWAETAPGSAVPNPRILDVGCGCGLVGLMLAQRYPQSSVEGVDIDETSVQEACENAHCGPFASRVRFFRADVREISCSQQVAGKYDVIVCNPPYYTEDTLPPDQRRSMARNSHHLSFQSLVSSVCRMMSADASFCVIIPMQARGQFVANAMAANLHLQRECRVRTVSRKEPKRVLLQFGFQADTEVLAATLTLQDDGGGRSLEYAHLCRDFYL